MKKKNQHSNKTNSKNSTPRYKNPFPTGTSKYKAFENVREQYATGKIHGENQGEKAFAKELKAQQQKKSSKTDLSNLSGMSRLIDTYSRPIPTPTFSKLQPKINDKKIVGTKKQSDKKSLSPKKYVPKQLIFDDIREYRSSKIISNISNGLATFIMKTTCNKNLTKFQMNLVISSVALVTSEVLNKALKKPREIANNIKVFIKVGKAIYKVILWYNEKVKSYEIQENSVEKVNTLSIEYNKFLRHNPKIKMVYKNQTNYNEILGKTITVIVDRPLGSMHPTNEQLIYPLNYGYIKSIYANDGEEQDAYVIGENEPLKVFRGKVIAIIHRLNDIEDKLVVTAKDKQFPRQEILDAVHFQEQFFEIELTTL